MDYRTATFSNAVHDPEILDRIRAALLEADERQPLNTRKNYQPKQKEWKEWCKRQAFKRLPLDWREVQFTWKGSLPEDLVDEGKLFSFIREAAARAPKVGKRVTKQKKERAAKRQRIEVGKDTIVVGGTVTGEEEEEEEEGEEGGIKPEQQRLTLQYNTVRGYISAVQRLYDQQKSLGVNPRPRPQGLATEAIKAGILRKSYQNSRLAFDDRGVGTIKDSYTASQIPAFTRCCWRGTDAPGQHLRTYVDFLLGNHMLLRYSNRSPIELADCFSLELPNEGSRKEKSPTKALIVVMRQGKTNSTGRMEYGAALRHRSPLSCVVGAFAFWFFYRWMVEGKEEFPSFRRSEDWYLTKVIRRSAAEPSSLFSRSSAGDWLSRMYEQAGIRVSKVTHAPRVSAAQNADKAGVREGEVHTPSPL